MTWTHTPAYHDFEGLKEIYNEKTHKSNGGTTVVLHSYNESDVELGKAINAVIEANKYADSEGIKGLVVKRVILSDQSPEELTAQKRNTLERVVNSIDPTLDKSLVPQIGYFRIGPDIYNHVISKWRDIPSLRPFVDETENIGNIFGKGINLRFSKELVKVLERDNRVNLLERCNRDPSVLFLDTDYQDRSPRQVVTNAFPLSHFGSNSVLGVFSRYHKNPAGEDERGGRVNAATGALFDMLADYGYMKRMGYACTGDQGFLLEGLDKVWFPRRYGIEASLRIQGHSDVSVFSPDNKPIFPHQDNFQVEIRGGDDSPIGYGKSRDDAMKGVINMTSDIAKTGLATIGITNLSKIWNTAEEFIGKFEQYQKSRFHVWRVASEQAYGKVLPITGGLKDEEIRTQSLEIFRNVSERFYKDSQYREGLVSKIFIPSAKSIRNRDGDEVYRRIGNDLIEFYTPINHNPHSTKSPLSQAI